MDTETAFDETYDLFLSTIGGAWTGFIVGIIGYVFISILIKPDSIFSFWTPFVHKVIGFRTDKHPKNWQLKLDNVYNNCSKCFSGQLALVIYLFNYRSFLALLIAVSIAILTAKQLEKKSI